MSRKTTRKSSRKKKKSGKIWGWQGKVGNSQRWAAFGRRLGQLLLVAMAGTTMVLGFKYMEKYIHRMPRYCEAPLEIKLVNPPSWASQELLDEVCRSTGLKEGDFLLDEDLTGKLALNLSDQNQCPWVKRVNQVRKRYDGQVLVDCELRRPIASISQGDKVRYVDVEGVMLPVAPLYGRDNQLVCLHGVDVVLGRPGEPINSPSLLAGIEVLALIRSMDEKLQQQERLWDELAVMDVSNYEGRFNPQKSHLVLYTHNNTEIRWGAAAGRSLPYYEAPVETKLSMLYCDHQPRKSLDMYKYVDLRNQRQEKTSPLRDGGKGNI